MDTHALDILEYPDLMQVIAGRAFSDSGRAWVLGLRPCRSLEKIRPYQELFSALQSVLEAGHSRPNLSFPDPADILQRVAPSNAVLGGDDLVVCRDLLRTVAAASEFLAADGCADRPPLRRIRRGLRRCLPLLKDIEKTVDDEGQIQDSASPELKKLRRQTRTLAEQAQRRLKSFLRASDLSEAFQEQFVTVRNGRYVVPVRRELRARVPGVVHDHSDSGHTLFIEPVQTLPLGNELADIRLHERDECRRVLAELSAAVREQLPALRRNVQGLARLDGACAVAAWGIATHGIQPRFGDVLRLTAARHPLLENQFRRDASSRQVVPIDVAFPSGASVMAVTGSNSGGKTAALKTVGLLTLAAQTGLPVSVDEGSTFELFDQVFADIGDEQSLQQDLSTFSGHMTRIAGIVTRLHGDHRSLILLDELGAGTDPLEGGVLACAILDELAGRNVLALITTHLGVVKTYVQAHAAMVNSAVRFDPETLEPEYILDVGRPGASHALNIAVRAGLPEKIATRARSLLDSDELRLERVLGRLEDQERRAANNEKELREKLDHVTRGREKLEHELNELRRERRRLLHEALLQAEQTVSRTQRQMETLLGEFRRAGEQKDRQDIEAAATAARQKLEAKKRRLRDGARQTSPRPTARLASDKLRPGQRVWVENLGGDATVHRVEAGGKRVTVILRGFRVTVSADQIGPPDSQNPAPPAPSGGRISLPRPGGPVSPELNLIGCRVDEALPRLDAFLDQAIMGNLRDVRIIHGFGTGRLRDAVHQHLRAHPLIAKIRLGKTGEDPGGGGATFVQLKR